MQIFCQNNTKFYEISLFICINKKIPVSLHVFWTSRRKKLLTMKKIHSRFAHNGTIHFMSLLCLATLLLTSCKSKDEVYNLVGNYTFKTSGVVSLQNAGSVVGDVHLTPETGTMTITSTDKDNEVKLSFNQNNGDVFDISALVTSDSLYIRSMHRNIDVSVAQDTLLSGNVIHHRETFDVEIKGAGNLLSNGDVCLMLTYSGVQRNDPSCVLSGTNIHTHCKRNAN